MGSLQDFRNFSVAIQDPKSREIAGTGFIVFTDGERVKIITAAHVVTDLHRLKSGIPRHPRELIGKHVGIHFFQPLESASTKRDRTAKVVACFSEFDDDVILLQLDGGDPRPPMSRHQAVLGTADPSKSHPYITFGFAEIGREYPGGISDGLILGVAPSKIEGVYHSEMVQLQANNLGVRIQKGMSGAAVLDRYRNLVVGIVTEFLLPSTTGVSWAADCKVLSFTPIGLELIRDDSQMESFVFAREAYDRMNYEYIRKPGLKLIHTPKSLKNWVGRQGLLELLDKYYWETPQCKLVEVVGFGGEGKSTLAQKWLEGIISGSGKGTSGKKPRGIFWWDFYYDRNSDGCIAQLLTFVTGSQEILTKIQTPSRRVEKIKEVLKAKGFLLVLDGFETIQSQYQSEYGEIVNKDLANLLEFLADEDHKSFCLVTSRVPLFGLVNTRYLRSIDVEDLSFEEGMDLLRKIGVKGEDTELKKLVVQWAGHPLTLTVLGLYIVSHGRGELSGIKELPSPLANEPPYERLQRLLFRYDQLLSLEERRFLQIFSAFRSPVDRYALKTVFRNRAIPLTRVLAKMADGDFDLLLEGILRKGLIRRSEPLRDYNHLPLKGTRAKKVKQGVDKSAYIIHPLLRTYFYESLSSDEKKSVNILLKKYVHKMQIPAFPKDVSQMRPRFDELHYMCEAGIYDDAYEFYRVKIAKEDEMPEDEPGYLTTALLAYQTDAELLGMFFEDRDWSKKLLIKNPKARADVMILAGVDLESLGDLENAVELYKKSALMGIEGKEWDYAVWSYQNICDAYTSSGRLAEALGAASLALRYIPFIKAQARESFNTYTRIAWTKLLLGDIPAAFEMLDRAEKIFKDNKRVFKKTPFSAERAWQSEIFLKTGKYQEAMTLARENLRVLEQFGWLDDVGQKRILSSVYLAQGRHKQALKLLNETIITMRNKGMKQELALSLLSRGQYFLDMQWYSQAKDDLDDALNIAKAYHYIWEFDIRTSLIELEILTSHSKVIFAKLRKELLSIQSAAIVTGYKWAEGDTLFLLGELERLDGKSKIAKQYYSQCREIRKAISDPKINQIKEEYLV